MTALRTRVLDVEKYLKKCAKSARVRRFVNLWRLRRRDGMTVADFKDYWLDVHAPIALHLPGMRRYVQCHAVAGAYGFGEPRWDGVAQTWFDDTDSLRRMLDSDEFKLRDMSDGEKFIGTLEVLVVREHDVI